MGERGGRLIHHYKASLCGQGATDRDELANRNWQSANRLRQRQIDSESLRYLPGLSVNFCPPHQASRLIDVMPKDDVFGY